MLYYHDYLCVLRKYIFVLRYFIVLARRGISSLMPWKFSLNPGSANFIVADGTACCRYDNQRCHQWWQSWHYDKSWFHCLVWSTTVFSHVARYTYGKENQHSVPFRQGMETSIIIIYSGKNWIITILISPANLIVSRSGSVVVAVRPLLRFRQHDIAIRSDLISKILNKARALS